jgi:hypothetical protein
MQRPKWLEGWGEGKNPLEAWLLIDTPDIKVVEANLSRKILFFAIGTHENAKSSEAKVLTNEAENGTNLRWKFFYDKTALTQLMPIERAKNLMAGIVVAISGSASVYDLETVYIPSGKKPAKGNAPVLLDYEMAKKIEEARGKRI